MRLSLSISRAPTFITVLGSTTYSPSVSKRRSALKARQSLSALQPLPRISDLSASILANADTTPTAIERAITFITRRRKARHVRLKELAKEEATWVVQHGAGDVGPDGVAAGIVCPVCSQPIRGDRDVVETHVDACLAYESRRTQVERERERTVGLIRGNEEVEVDVDMGWDAAEEESTGIRVITNANLQGTGIHIRPSTMDTEDDIDIDGTDDVMFGDAQFAEADVVKVESEDLDWVQNVDSRSNHDQKTRASTPTDVSSLSQPGTSGEDMGKLDLAILAARSRGDNLALIVALEAKLNAMVCLPLGIAHMLICCLVSLRLRLVVSVCRRTSIPQCRQGVGTRAVRHVG